ncbi:MAG: hypothetical protein K2R93_10830 [Gemmatimonadaceae bacterium]|nr:hypothetical protein [Gemmatimonadaceae bacterium]
MLRSFTFVVLAAAAATLTACADGSSPLTAPVDARQGKFIEPPPAPSNMPTTAPAPGVIYRESFGADQQWRPTGGKGTLKYVALDNSIAGFWAEWPNNKNVAWIDGDLAESWKWAACSLNDNQMPSPIDVAPFNGCLFSGEFNGMTVFPSALLPFVAPRTAYEFSIDGYPRPVAGAYIAMGFTNTRVTSKALANSGTLWLKIDNSINNPGPMHYQLRLNGMTGPILAEGNEGYAGFNPMKLRIDPVAQTVTLTINNVVIGTYNAAIAPPTYLALEGYGLFDNMVVRQ